MSKILPFDRNPDEAALAEELDSPTADSDANYNEEMSRAAVGRLFDEDDGGRPASASAFVTGFDRAPPRPQGKREKQRDDPPPAEPRESIEPKQDARAERKRDDSIEGTDKADRPGRAGASERAGRHTDMDRDDRPPIDAPHEEPIIERPRARRESATSRLIQGDQPDDFFEAGFRDGRAARDRDRRRAGNPDPRPAVRVNVERQEGAAQSEEFSEPSEATYDSFRQRYNPNELVSSPRNPNRPVRPGQPRDVRTDRMRAGVHNVEAVSPLRWIAAGALIVVLALIAFLTFRVSSLASQRDEAIEDRDAALAAAALNDGAAAERDRLRIDYQEMTRARNELQDRVNELESPAVPGQDGRPGEPTGETPGPPTPPASLLPAEHTVRSGETLNVIAGRFFGNTDIETLRHIQRTNPIITDINNIQVGWVLNLVAMDE